MGKPKTKTETKAVDTVKLAKGEGIFIDYETGFEISNQEEVELTQPIGLRTKLALQSGGLLLIEAESPVATDDFPKDIPGRDLFIAAGLTFEKLKGLGEDEFLKIEGVTPDLLKELTEFTTTSLG